MNVRLRILLTIFFAALGVLALREEYLRRCSVFHQREASRYAEMIGTRFNVTPVEVESALEVAADNRDDFRLDYKFQVVLHHRAVAKDYQRAAYHPWLVVHEPPLPERHYED